MTRRAAHALLAAAGAIALAATVAHAQDVATPPHVRAEGDDTRPLLNELVARSPTARDLVDRLEASDVVVYIRQRWLRTATLRGQTGFVSSTVPRRLLVIEINTHLTHKDLLVALGHELRHAVEIAESPEVCDVASMAVLYNRIGDLTGYSAGFETYETQAAADAGRRIRVELALPLPSAATPTPIAIRFRSTERSA